MSIGTSISVKSFVRVARPHVSLSFVLTFILNQAMKTKHLRVTTRISVMRHIRLRRLTLPVVHTILKTMHSHHLLLPTQKLSPTMEINLHLLLMKSLLFLLTILKTMQVNVLPLMILIITHLHPEFLVTM